MTAVREPRLALSSGTGQARRDSAAIGLLAASVSFAFSWVPSLWYDEVATVVAATRGADGLWRLVQTVDAVHGVYYAGIWAWFELVGYSPVTLRLPSALFAGLAAALTVLLVARLSGRRLAVVAGLVLCLLPRFTWAGAEGRSYSLTVLCAAASTYALVAALGLPGRGPPAPRRRAWVLYVAASAFAAAVFVQLAFLVVAHAITVVWLALAGRIPGALVRRFAIAAVVAALAIAPMLLVAALQTKQVAWIDPIGWHTLHGVLVTQFAPGNRVFAAVAWPLAALGAAMLVWPRRGGARTGPEPRGTSTPLWRVPMPMDRIPLAAVALPLLVVPTLCVLLASVGLTPMYSPRYLSDSLPALAALVAVPLVALRRRAALAAALVVLAALSAPSYVAQRMPEAKQSSSWSHVAATIAEHRESQPRDPAGVLFGTIKRHPLATTRTIAYAYPDAFIGLRDLTLETPYWASSGLWESSGPLEASALTGLESVWIIEAGSDTARESARIERAGFSLDAEWRFSGVRLSLYGRQ